ncbi:ricin B-like lectin R40G3 [Momordica charantia]|uniref:Ricin B-like lectin R40G3 n=1 Tax=Momordica charantia TaxID=3673 RepID=A0A6J1DST7_MOMCH|nr:ricin B-like lectin R40G3 [Momordica charantia]
MAFPFHHHHRRDDDEDGPRYPPPGYQPPYSDPPPPPVPNVHHTHHTHHEPSPPPPSYVAYHSNFPPEPPVVSFGYSAGPPPPPSVHHTHQPHSAGIVHSHSHQSDSRLSNRPTVKVYSKANPNFSLAIRHGKVVLVPSDPYDLTQHWYKDEEFSTRVKDEEGAPCFALVNKATGQAMKHSTGDTHPVQLISYNPNVLDESVLWTQSKEFGEGYRAIRMVNNIHLNVDAYHGDKYSGGVHDGTQIVLWKWKEGDNQLWKIVPY